MFVSSVMYMNVQDVNYGFQKSKEMLESSKNHPSHSPSHMESSPPSTILENELTIPTTCADSTTSKYQDKHFLTGVSTECCESGQTSSDQDCFMVDTGNIEEQLSVHFQHGSSVNHEEEMEMTFPRSVYGEIEDKDIASFHNEGAVFCLTYRMVPENIHTPHGRFWA